MERGSDIIEKERKALTFSGCIILMMLTALLSVLFAPRGGLGINGIRVSTRLTESQIVTALNVYKTEYGHLPIIQTDDPYEDPASQARLFAVLRAFDTQQNPRGIIYFEARNARLGRRHWWESKKLRDGFDPHTGTLLDPYGHPYRICLKPRDGSTITSPYTDLPADGGLAVVWSLGEDGKQGNPNDPKKYQGSDDIASWTFLNP